MLIPNADKAVLLRESRFCSCMTLPCGITCLCVRGGTEGNPYLNDTRVSTLLCKIFLKPIDKVGFKCYILITYQVGKYLDKKVFRLKNYFEALVRANFRFGRMCG